MRQSDEHERRGFPLTGRSRRTEPTRAGARNPGKFDTGFPFAEPSGDILPIRDQLVCFAHLRQDSA